MIASAIY